MEQENPVIRDGVRLDYLQQLRELGIKEEIAKRALIDTNNQSVEIATNLAFELSDSEWEDMPDDFKMTFVVNASLNMGVGKIASQVAHAAINLYRKLLISQPQAEKSEIWQQYGEKKIVLAGENAKHLMHLEKVAQGLNIPCVLITDAGRTEIPANSTTVFALFGLEEEINKVTGNLKLL